jgi:hypothetical protein
MPVGYHRNVPAALQTGPPDAHRYPRAAWHRVGSGTRRDEFV